MAPYLAALKVLKMAPLKVLKTAVYLAGSTLTTMVACLAVLRVVKMAP